MASRHKQLQRRTDLEHSQVSKLDQGELSGKLTKRNGGHDAVCNFFIFGGRKCEFDAAANMHKVDGTNLKKYLTHSSLEY